MAHTVFRKLSHLSVYRLLLSACLILQTNHIMALNTVSDDVNTPLTILTSVATDDHLESVGKDTSENAVVRQLFVWINAHMSFALPLDDFPVIKRVTINKLVAMASGGKGSNKPEQITIKILGLYNFEEKVVYLLNNINLQVAEGRGVLLHELVHFLQYQHGHDKEVSCVKELEAMAYRLETEYLKDYDRAYPLHNTNKGQRSICVS
ncbi:MAG: hypothetical protein ACI9MF_000206 [Gammaproteobacteria bacterium]|jgi:hypothetical protein